MMKNISEKVSQRIIEVNSNNSEITEKTKELAKDLKEAIEGKEISYVELNQAITLLDDSYYQMLLKKDLRV